MTVPVRAEILLNISNWQKNLEKTSKQMAGFGKSMKTISNGVKAAWAGVAVLGIGAVYDAIVDVTKAAAEDNRSMALLNEQMRRTWNGNEQLNESIDKQIDAMSNATGIADDKLRPALIRIAAVTKSPAKGMKMLKLATDIAAKSGKDLNMVSMNMAKFLGGNKTALDKLVPGLAKSGDRMKFLKDNYAGFAEISGQNDPFGRIEVVLDNFKEKLGKAFLPLANDVADWLASPEAQAALDDIAKQVQDAFAWLTSPEGKAQMKEWMNQFMVLIKSATDLALTVADLLAGGKKHEQALSGALNTRKGSEAFNFMGGGPTGRFKLSSAEALTRSSGNMSTVGGTVVNIYGTVSGNDVVKALKNIAGQKGMTLGRLLR